MLKILKKNTGMISMIEIMITAIIFTLAAFGILTSITMFRPQTTSSREKVTAAYAGKQFVENLRSEIWSYAPGTYTNTFGNYSITWTVADDPSGARALTLNLSY